MLTPDNLYPTRKAYLLAVELLFRKARRTYARTGIVRLPCDSGILHNHKKIKALEASSMMDIYDAILLDGAKYRNFPAWESRYYWLLHDNKIMKTSFYQDWLLPEIKQHQTTGELFTILRRVWNDSGCDPDKTEQYFIDRADHIY